MFKNYGLFLLLALLWSFSFLGIKISVDVFPPVFSAMLRVLVAFISLTLIFSYRFRQQQNPLKNLFILPFSQAWRLWVTGLFTQAIPFGCLFFGEKFIAPGLASIINSTVSIWALVLGGLFFRDLSQFTPAKLLGLLLGFVGILSIFLPYLSLSHAGSIVGIVSVFIMAISYAMGGLLTQHLVFKKMKTGFELNLWHQHFFSLIALSVFSFSVETHPALKILFNTKVILAILYLGVCATAIAWIIYFYLLKHWGTVRAASVMYIVPILAIFWDYLFLGLIPGWNEWLGIFSIFSGVTLIQYQKSTSQQNSRNGC